MKIVIAIDSFKGSLTSLEAGAAAEKGVRRVFPEAETVVKPLADGGEGTMKALTCGVGGAEQIARSRTAVIDIAQAAGLTLIPEAARDPLTATTFGVGELLAAAIKKGARRLIVGLGGSGTNDGGAGMLQALGFELLDAAGKPIMRGARGLADLAQIKTDHALPELAECTFEIACDVENPLYGPHGSSVVFAPQKGAAAEMIPKMDRWLKHYAALASKIFPQADPTLPGSGAAGGLGFAFAVFLGARLLPGVELAEALSGADLLITGEGRIDAQTAMGKAPAGAAKIAKRAALPVVAFSGSLGSGANAVNEAGIDAFFAILPAVIPLAEAMEKTHAAANLCATVEQALRLWQIAQKSAGTAK
jgi:glycerate kinase